MTEGLLGGTSRSASPRSTPPPAPSTSHGVALVSASGARPCGQEPHRPRPHLKLRPLHHAGNRHPEPPRRRPGRRSRPNRRNNTLPKISQIGPRHSKPPLAKHSKAITKIKKGESRAIQSKADPLQEADPKLITKNQCVAFKQSIELVLSRLRSGLPTDLCGLSLKCQGAFAT